MKISDLADLMGCSVEEVIAQLEKKETISLALTEKNGKNPKDEDAGTSSSIDDAD